MIKDLTTIQDLSKEDILTILDLAKRVKADKMLHSNLLVGKSVGLVFQKPSNRTRVSFDVGVAQLGGHCLYLGPDEINLGVRETTADVAKTLSRYLDIIVARTFSHQDLVDLSMHATVPVINGLSDLSHPCQALTDILSISENFDSLENLTVTYIGDGNNVCNSLLLACAKLGIHMNVATPVGYEVPDLIKELAATEAAISGSKLLYTNSPEEAVKGAHAIYADVWVSMGQEEETKKRLKEFEGFQINATLVAQADPNYIFMHCLPAHRGQEVTEDVIDGEHSIIFDQAENRLHTQKAVMIFLMGEK